MGEKVIGRKAYCCFFLHLGDGCAFCLDNSNTSPSQFPNPLAPSKADNLSNFTWVFFCRWSIRATARRPEDNWLFTSKMQLLHRNKTLSFTGLLQICSSCKELLSIRKFLITESDFYKTIHGRQTHPCKLMLGDQSWSSVRSIKWIRSGKNSKYSSSSTLYILYFLYCFVIYILYFLYTYFRSGKSSQYFSSSTFVSVHKYIFFICELFRSTKLNGLFCMVLYVWNSQKLFYLPDFNHLGRSFSPLSHLPPTQ